MSTSYVQSVLLDGATPFRYRIGVRSLLGVPESDGGDMIFSPAMPPIGLAYANSQFRGGPQAAASGERGGRATGVAQQDITRPASEQDKRLTRPSEIQPEAGTVLEKATVHVPDTPQWNKALPTPSRLGQRQHLSSKVEEQFQHAPSPEHSWSKAFPTPSRLGQKQHLSSKVEEQFQHAPCPEHSPQTSIPRLRREGSSVSVQVEGSDGGRKPDEAVSRYSAAASKFNQPNPLPLKGRECPSEGHEHELTFTPPIKATHSSERLAQIHPGTGYGSSRAADRIEQLRTTVQELARKQSPPREQKEDGTPPPQQRQLPLPPTAQQLVVVEQPVIRGRIPHAFWERSYLGRVRVRILR